MLKNEIDYNNPGPYYSHPCEEARQCQSSDSRSIAERLGQGLIEKLSSASCAGLEKSEGEKQMIEEYEYDSQPCDLSDDVEEVLHEEDVAQANVQITSEIVFRAASDRLTELFKSVRLDREEFGDILDELLSQFGFISVDMADLGDEEED